MSYCRPYKVTIPVESINFDTIITLFHTIQALMNISLKVIEELEYGVVGRSPVRVVGNLYLPTIVIEHHVPFFIFLLERRILQQLGHI